MMFNCAHREWASPEPRTTAPIPRPNLYSSTRSSGVDSSHTRIMLLVLPSRERPTFLACYPPRTQPFPYRSWHPRMAPRQNGSILPVNSITGTVPPVDDAWRSGSGTQDSNVALDRDQPSLRGTLPPKSAAHATGGMSALMALARRGAGPSPRE